MLQLLLVGLRWLVVTEQGTRFHVEEARPTNGRVDYLHPTPTLPGRRCFIPYYYHYYYPRFHEVKKVGIVSFSTRSTRHG